MARLLGAGRKTNMTLHKTKICLNCNSTFVPQKDEDMCPECSGEKYSQQKKVKQVPCGNPTELKTSPNNADGSPSISH